MLTFSEFMDLAKKTEGGRDYLECWDRRTFDTYVSVIGPITRSAALQMFADAHEDELEDAWRWRI